MSGEELVLERVPPDAAAAQRDLDAARTHVVSLERVAARDPVGAFTLAYEAARKAIRAHMRDRGLRVRLGRGGHVQTGRYAIAALSGRGIDAHLRAFEDMRRLRNKTAYDAVVVGALEVGEALAHARAIIAVVESELA